MSHVPHHASDVYVFHDFHVHHGGTRDRRDSMASGGQPRLFAGAEHTVDGRRFDGEVHLVFYNQKYGRLANASQHADGVAVLGLFVQVVSDDKVHDGRFTTFVQQNIPRVTADHSEVDTELDLGMFLARGCHFYTYHGSLTTPLCNESVTWMVLRDPLEVSSSAWYNFGSVQSRGGYNTLYGNYRVTMPINDRVVEANFRPADPQLLSATQYTQPVYAQRTQGTHNSTRDPQVQIVNSMPNLSQTGESQQSRISIPTVINREQPQDRTRERRPSSQRTMAYQDQSQMPSNHVNMQSFFVSNGGTPSIVPQSRPQLLDTVSTTLAAIGNIGKEQHQGANIMSQSSQLGRQYGRQSVNSGSHRGQSQPGINGPVMISRNKALVADVTQPLPTVPTVGPSYIPAILLQRNERPRTRGEYLPPSTNPSYYQLGSLKAQNRVSYSQTSGASRSALNKSSWFSTQVIPLRERPSRNQNYRPSQSGSRLQTMDFFKPAWYQSQYRTVGFQTSPYTEPYVSNGRPSSSVSRGTANGMLYNKSPTQIRPLANSHLIQISGNRWPGGFSKHIRFDDRGKIVSKTLIHDYGKPVADF